MNALDAIRCGLEMADYVSLAYLQDLSDRELMQRPHPGCNHINWQVGHLILAEHQLIEKVAPGKMPPLPSGFAARYAKETASSDDASQFLTKDELLVAQRTQRQGTLAALAACSEADLDRSTGVDYAPTVGAMFSMQGSHWLMHAGQWAVVRRQLGRPALF